jgi:hypothetical protein
VAEPKSVALYDENGAFQRMITGTEAIALFPDNPDIARAFPVFKDGRLMGLSGE